MADSEPSPPTPRWVKGFAVAGTLIVVVAVILLLSGHGPWQHGSVTVRQ